MTQAIKSNVFNSCVMLGSRCVAHEHEPHVEILILVDGVTNQCVVRPDFSA